MPEGLQVNHTCDNRACCNPAHLKLGRPADNTRDMMERGRHNPVKGGAVKMNVLSDSDVIDIKIRLRGGESQRSLARKYGVGKSTIWSIAAGINWAWVKIPGGGHDAARNGCSSY